MKKNELDKKRYQQLVKLGKSPFKAVSYCKKNRHDVGLTGMWTVANYGGELTYYILYRVLQKMGYSVLMIERRRNLPNYNQPVPRAFRKIPYPEYDICPIHKSYDEQYALNELVPVYIVGSDQVWNGEIINSDAMCSYTLDYTADKNTRIAYATSFGNSVFTGSPQHKMLLGKFLKRFDHISVRERSGIDICRNEFGIQKEVVNVLDPVLLCDRSVFNELTCNSQCENITGYICSYFVRPDRSCAGLDSLAQRMGKKLVNTVNFDKTVLDKMEFKGFPWEFSYCNDCLVEDWLQYLSNSDFIVTDSFHAVCVALAFEKPFVFIKGYSTVEQHGLDRIITITEKLGLQDRIMNTVGDAVRNADKLVNLDYTDVNAILKQERERSLNWLKNAIENK